MKEQKDKVQKKSQRPWPKRVDNWRILVGEEGDLRIDFGKNSENDIRLVSANILSMDDIEPFILDLLSNLLQANEHYKLNLPLFNRGVAATKEEGDE